MSPETVADLMVQRGYFEAITYSFFDPDLQAVLCPGEPALRLANPISADLAEMRVSLWPGLVRTLMENLRRQQPRVRLFELGRKFRLDGATLNEIPVIAGIAAGLASAEQWGIPDEESDTHWSYAINFLHYLGERNRSVWEWALYQKMVHLHNRS